MRIKRTVSKPGTARRDQASEASVTALKVLPPPAGSHARRGDASLDASADPIPATLEAMFREISSVDPGEGDSTRSTLAATRYDDLWQLSLADPVTGLANRMLLLDRLTRELTRCRRHGGCVVVSHIDLGNLKDINDELGYPSGQRGAAGHVPAPDLHAPQRGHREPDRRERAGGRHDHRERAASSAR